MDDVKNLVVLLTHAYGEKVSQLPLAAGLRLWPLCSAMTKLCVQMICALRRTNGLV